MISYFVLGDSTVLNFGWVIGYALEFCYYTHKRIVTFLGLSKAAKKLHSYQFEKKKIVCTNHAIGLLALTECIQSMYARSCTH